MWRRILVIFLGSLVIQSIADDRVKNNSKDEESCGGSFFGYQYTINSPNYPGNYPANKNCLYELRGSRLAPCRQEYHLQFLDFDLHYTENCSEDFLQIGERTVYCDKVSGVRQFRAGESGLKIVFHSGKSSGGKGFKILVTTLPCINSRNDTDSNELSADYEKYKNHKTVFATQTFRPVFKPVTKSIDEKRDTENVTIEPLIDKPRKNQPEISSFLYVPPLKFEKELYEPPLHFNLTVPRLQPVEFRNSDEKKSLDSSQRLEIPAEDALRGDIPVVIPEDDSSADKSQDRNYDDSNFHSSNENDFFVSTSYGNPIPSVGINGIPSTNYGSPPLINSFPTNVVPTGNGNFFPNNNDCITPNNVPLGISDVNGISGINGVNVINNGNSYCCNKVFSGRRFTLVSPGFPTLFYSSDSYSCSYVIRKYSSQVCRLRLTLKFFNHGADNQYCNYGYVEIDGRRICGCKTGQTFTIDYPYVQKNINVRYVGYPRVKYNGFVIDISQEFCGNYYYNSLSRSKKDLESGRNGNSSLEVEKISWKNTTSSTEDGSKEDRTKRELGYIYSKPSIEFPTVGVEEVFNGGSGNGNLVWGNCQNRAFFDWILVAKEVYLTGSQCSKTSGGYPGQNPGGYPGGYPGQNPGGYPGQNPGGYPGQNPGGYPGQIPGGYPGQNPGGYPGQNPGGYPGQNPGGYPGQNPGGYPGQNPGGYPGQNPGGYPGQNPGGYPPLLPTPPSGSNGWIPSPGYPTTNCENINVLDGTISSPLYPNYYPNNANICYRFSQAPAYCYLQLKFLDFDVENSIGCSKDYVTVTGTSGRYCGRSLTGRRLMIDLTRNTVVAFRFVSDSYGSGKGFNVGFTQIPCQGLVNF